MGQEGSRQYGRNDLLRWCGIAAANDEGDVGVGIKLVSRSAETNKGRGRVRGTKT